MVLVPTRIIPGRTHQAGLASFRGRETDRRANDRRRWGQRSSRTPALFGDLRTLEKTPTRKRRRKEAERHSWPNECHRDL
jgi:hypothetical protein